MIFSPIYTTMMRDVKQFFVPVLVACISVTACKKADRQSTPVSSSSSTDDASNAAGSNANARVETGGSITVALSTPKQKIDLLGGGCYFYSGHIKSLSNYNDATNWLWNDLNVNVFRIVLRSGGVEDVNDNSNPDITDFTKFNFAANSNNVDQIAAAKRAIAIDPNIKIWAMVLSPPKYLKTNNDVNKGGTLNTSVTNAYKEFGEIIYAHLKNLKDNGLTVSYLSMMNEPDFVSTTIPYESAEYTKAQALSVYTNTGNWLKTKLPSASITVPVFTGADCISVSNADDYITEINKSNNVGLFTTHQYSNSSAANFTTASAAAGTKGLYMAEWHAGFGLGATPDEMTSAFDLVNKFHDAFRGGAKGWLYFEWGSPGVNFSGLVFTPFGGTAVRKKNYYVYKQFTDNLLNQNYIATTLSGIVNFGADNVSAFTSTGRADVNVMNWNNDAQNRVRLNFGRTFKNIRIYRTNATESNKLIWSQDNVNLNYYDVDFAGRSFTTVKITW
jgi:O-glycosyl hydrolase